MKNENLDLGHKAFKKFWKSYKAVKVRLDPASTWKDVKAPWEM